MIKIALVCSVGTTSNILTKSMLKAAKEQQLLCKIEWCSIEKSSSLMNAYDVVLLAPQVRFNLMKIKKMLSPIPVDVIEAEVFNQCDGLTVLNRALQLANI